ncbi:MAG: hypothetical protein HY904_03450 [Deltaproteobacteria bacterium]|nr:hypothetical protein [Deltaproteobacteria bacterium]
MTRGRLLALLLALAPLASCWQPPFGRQVRVGPGTTLDLSLLSDERFALVKAIDVLVFPRAMDGGGERDCLALMTARLADTTMRSQSTEHVRLCEGRDKGTLGKVEMGSKVVLVTASYVDACNDRDQDEITLPGQVLAVGCEPIDVAPAKTHDIDVMLVPARDAIP